MLNKFKNVFISLLVFCFSFTTLSAKQNDISKQVNFYSKFKAKQKNKKQRKNRKISRDNRFRSTKKNSQIKNFKIEDLNKIPIENLDYDLSTYESEIFTKIVKSNFGYNFTLQSQKLIEVLEEMYKISFSDLDVSSELFNLEELGVKNFEEIFDGLRKLNSVIQCIHFNNLTLAELKAIDIKILFYKNLALDFIFNNYIQKKDLQSAHRILSLIEFEEDEDFGEYDCYLKTLIIACLQNKNFEMAENLVNNMKDNWNRDNALTTIVKYFTKINDVKNANRVLQTISSGYRRQEAMSYLLDLYARQKNISEFQKLAFSSNSTEFQGIAKFILAFYENNFDEMIEIIQNGDCGYFNYEDIFQHFVEILCATNHIKEAEEIIKIFDDELYVSEEFDLFILNAYLKNGKIEEAKKIKDQMNYDFLNKLIASKLIKIYVNE